MRFTSITKVALILIAMQSMLAYSAERKDVFADPENLKVLPKDITSAQLRETMKTFSMSLGLRCNSCHVGEPGKPLTTYDFASDEKKLKEKARIMLKMVENLNHVQVAKLDPIDGDNKKSRVEITCVTCHRGQQKPELIQEVLADQLKQKGVNATVEKYRELRNKYYGGHTFDFSENVLPMFSAEHFTEKNQANDAIALLEANIEYFPKSFFGHFSLGSAYQMAGNKVKAKTAYEKALELNPKANFVRQKLEGLKK